MEGRDERQLIGSKRAWQAGDTSYDAEPSRFQDSKKARKEKENEFFLWGMRNPDLAVKKMHMARTVGADISRAWNHFLDRHSQGKEIAEAYSGNPGEDLKAKDFEDVVMKEEYEFSSPFNAKHIWEACITASGD